MARFYSATPAFEYAPAYTGRLGASAVAFADKFRSYTGAGGGQPRRLSVSEGSSPNCCR